MAADDATTPAVAAPSYDPPIRPELIEQTQRFKRLNILDAYFAGTQYEGLPDFWTGLIGDSGTPAPLRERAPCIVYPLPKAAVNQATRFTFGEGRFPTLKVQPVDAEDAIAPALALSDKEAALLHAAIVGLVEQARLRSAMRTLLRRGLSCCTGVAVISLRGGRFELDLPHPKNCIPTFAPGSCSELAALTVCYRFDKLVPDEKTGEIKYKSHWYRRDITATEYVVFEDALIDPAKRDIPIAWTRDDAVTVKHNLGFCPAVWIPNLRENDGDPDGSSLYEGLEDEFDALNFALSQRHRGINYWGVPQPWEALGDVSLAPAGAARVAAPVNDSGGARGYSRASGGSDGGARATAPDHMWTYRDAKAQVGLLETTGKAFDAASKHVLDIRARILEAIDVVLLDPSTIAGKGDISAKALSYLYAPLLGLVDELRECWWTHGLQPIIGMMLRIIAKLDGQGIYLPAIKRVTALVRGFVIEGRWLPPAMTPIWGNYFSPSNAEIQMAVTTAALARGKLISKRSATRFVASDFGVEDVDEELEEIEKDNAEAQAQAVDAVAAGAGADVAKPKIVDPKNDDGGETGVNDPEGREAEA
jgi:hypothetical protein